MVSGIYPPSPIKSRHDISGNECLLPHEKSTDCHVGHKQLFLIIGRRKESTSQVILVAMYQSWNLLEHSRMYVEGFRVWQSHEELPWRLRRNWPSGRKHAQKNRRHAHTCPDRYGLQKALSSSRNSIRCAPSVTSHFGIGVTPGSKLAQKNLDEFWWLPSVPSSTFWDNTLTLRRLMSYIYGAPILDVSRSHTTTQHSR